MNITKNGMVLRISREMALDYGMAEPTPEEAAERAASRDAFRQSCRDAWAVYEVAVTALSAITEPAARAVLDLHAVNDDGYALTCDHCWQDTEMGDRTDWPCETVATIAGVHEIELPTMSLYRDSRP